MRTDLAKESRDRFPDCPGVSEETERFDGITVVRIDVTEERAARLLDKPIGSYVTIHAEPDLFADADGRKTISILLSRELERVTGKIRNALVVGLGNRYVTADALGTKTAEYVLVTRHVHLHMKELLPADTPVTTSFCANVFGVTGLETAEVVSAVTEKIRPGLVILVDSLAASSIDHIGCTIQFNDSGIAPGAGVGNFRSMLTKESLHVPVIAIGVPTVVSANTIVSAFGGQTVSDPAARNFIVTPKDIDALIRDASRVLADAINRTVFGDSYTELEKILR